MAARIVDFNDLPKSVRERFIGCAAGTLSPAPLLFIEEPHRKAILGWAAVAVLGVATTCGALVGGYGVLVQGPEVIFVLALGVATFLLGLLAIARRVRLKRALPWKPGRYLFPMDCIDARTSELRLVPMNTLVNFRGVHHHMTGTYSGTHLHFEFQGGLTETFIVRSKVVAESVLANLRTSQKDIQSAAAERDIDAMFALDPFLEVRVNDGWHTKSAARAKDIEGPKAGAVGLLASRGLVWATGAVVGALAAFPMWSVRNRMSDDAMFARAVAENSESGFLSYLRTGHRHEIEVRDRLLPKAALARAISEGSITAIDIVMKAYPGKSIDEDARAAIHRLFDKALTDFRAEASADPRLVPFMEKLVRYLEKSGSPAVDVRFRSRAIAANRLMDQLRKARAGIEDLSRLVPVGPHFDDAHSMPREAMIVKNLDRAFSSIFATDIMQLQAGQRVVLGANADAKAEELPEVEIPTIDVSYEVGWAGDIYTEEKGDRKFVGIAVNFAVSMRVPHDAETYDFALEVRPPDEFSVESLGSSSGLAGKRGLPTEGEVYDVMATRAFDQLATKLHAVFFRPGSRADVPLDATADSASPDDGKTFPDDEDEGDEPSAEVRGGQRP